MQEEKSKNTITLQLTQYLEAKGHRKTPERYAILDKVYAINHHFDVDLLYAEMAQTEYPVSKATVYNTIDLLLEAGLVRKHQFGNHPAQYECAYNMVNHHHLICTSCGKVIESKDMDIQDILEHKKFSKFTPSYYTLYIYGKCNRCTAAEKRKRARVNKKQQ